MRPAISLTTASSSSPSSHIYSRLTHSPSHYNTPSMASTGSNSLMWFRKGLRLHDNPVLQYAAKGSTYVYPVFVIDPHYMEPDPTSFSPGSKLAGLNRIRFLLESLVDLDSSLRKLGSRLLVLKAEPSDVLIRCLKEWDIRKLCFEYDTEPYYQALDSKVKAYTSVAGVDIFSPVSHTLFTPAEIIQKNGGKPPVSYQTFLKLARKPSWESSSPVITLSTLSPLGEVGDCMISEVPTIKELGYEDTGEDQLTYFKGGESEALRRLNESTNNKTTLKVLISQDKLCVVSHDSVSKECQRKLAEAYRLNKEQNDVVSNEDLQRLRRKFEEDRSSKNNPKRLKQTLIG